MGHQEIKLAVAGLSDDEIASLDGDWSPYTPAQRAAFEFAKKLTHQPHTLAAADLDALRPHYTDLQILEMLISVAGNNATNRWKEAIGISQEREASRFLLQTGTAPSADRQLPIKSFLTPTSENFKEQVSKLVPARRAEDQAVVARLAAARRPKLESRAEVESALAAARLRTPRLPLLAEEECRAVLPAEFAARPLPQWVRLLAHFPKEGVSRVRSVATADEKGDLAPKFNYGRSPAQQCHLQRPVKVA